MRVIWNLDYKIPFGAVNSTILIIRELRIRFHIIHKPHHGSAIFGHALKSKKAACCCCHCYIMSQIIEACSEVVADRIFTNWSNSTNHRHLSHHISSSINNKTTFPINITCRSVTSKIPRIVIMKFFCVSLLFLMRNPFFYARLRDENMNVP